MGFLHPGIVWATIPLAALPLLIHLLNRRRYREEPWAAMTFLLRAHRRSRRRIRLEHWLLMAARTIVLILIGLAVARPHAVQTSMPTALGEPRFDRVIIIDDSLSMQARREDGSMAFDAARRLAIDLIEGFNDGDRAAVATAAGQAVARTRLVHDHAAVRSVVGSLSCTSSATNLSAALKAANELLSKSEAREGGRLVYVLTDLSVASIQHRPERPGTSVNARGRAADPPETPPAADRPATADLSAIDSVVFVNVGPDRRPNLAIRGLRCRSQFVGVGVPALCTIEVANHGDSRSAPAELELRVDGAVVRRVEIPPLVPGANHIQEYQIEFERGGSHRLSAYLRPTGPDVLEADNIRHLAPTVMDGLSVLAVEGRPDAGLGRGELFFYSVALASIDGGDQRRGARVRTVTSVEIEDQVLADHDVIVLGNVDRLAGPAWDRLERYVREGGGLVVMLGDRVVADQYNRHAGRRGSDMPLLPMALTEPVGVPPDDDPLTLSMASPNHPALVDLVGHKRGGLTTAHVRGYWRTEAGATNPTARRLLNLSSGEPAVVACEVGRGRVVVSLIGSNMAWTNLPSKPDFVPLVLNLTAYAAGNKGPAHNVRTGAPLVERAAAAQSVLAGRMVRPDGSDVAVESEPLDDARAFVYRDSGAPGIYSLQVGRTTTHFAVNVHEADGVLPPVSPAALRAAFGEKAVVVAASDIKRAESTLAPRREYTSLLMAALLAMVVGEGALATWFGHRR